MSQTKSQRVKERIKNVLKIALAWVIISQFVFFYETSVIYYYKCEPVNFDFATYYIANIFSGLLAGIMGGYFVMEVMEKWIRNISYYKVLQNLFIGFTIVFFIVSISTAFLVVCSEVKKNFYHPEVLEKIWNFLIEFQYLRSYFVWLFITLSTVIVLLVNDKYGPGVFTDFLLGCYFKPKREERIFMFLDLRSSTTIAEKLGEEKYFSFIKDVFRGATPGILDAKGEIYQYVGDEIVVSWKMENGRKNANCLRCFFDIKHALARQSNYFLEKYGVKPEFKAGLHYGHVMAGEVGVVKRDIAFSGDVLNTAARIQSKCNELKVDILFSKYLLDKLALPPHVFEPKKMGDMLLRGKNLPVVLYTA